MNNFQSIIDYTDKNRKTIAIMTLSYQDAGARGGDVAAPIAQLVCGGQHGGRRGCPFLQKLHLKTRMVLT